MKRTDAMQYVSFGVDDALSIRNPQDAPANARLVGYQCGFEPMFVAVWSYLDVRIDDCDAEDLARDALIERGWFADCDNPQDADFII